MKQSYKNIAKSSLVVAESFFDKLNPWFKGDIFWLYRRYLQESQQQAHWTKTQQIHAEKSYYKALASYKKPELTLGYYSYLHQHHLLKIKIDNMVLWQYLHLAVGELFYTHTFLKNNDSLLTQEQKNYVLGYGLIFPDFLTLFHSLSIDVLAFNVCLAKRPSVLFSSQPRTLSPDLNKTLFASFSQSGVDQIKISRPKIMNTK